MLPSPEQTNGEDQKEPEKKPVRVSPFIKKGFIETAHVDVQPLEPFSFQYRPPVSSEIESHAHNMRMALNAADRVKEYAQFFSTHVVSISYQGLDVIPGNAAFPELRPEAFNEIYAILNSAEQQVRAKIKN